STVVVPSERPSPLISSLHHVSTDDHVLVVHKMGCDPEVWPSRSDISRRHPFATRVSQFGLADPPFVPFRSVRRLRNAFSYVVKINIPISSFDDQLFFQVSSPPEHSRETEKPRLAAHATPRNDEKRLSIHSNGPCLLEGRTSEHSHLNTP